MAELSVGNLEMQITADGSAAIRELESVEDAARGMAQGVEAAGRQAGDGLDDIGEGAQQATPPLNELGAAGEAAGEKIGEGADKAGTKLKDLGKTLSDIGGKATKFLTLPIVGALGVAVKGASDLSETVSKAEVVFDEFSGKIMDWSDTSIEAMGLAQGSALEYASTFGDMGKGMGLTTAQATDMSMSLTQLAADLASFKNISTETAASKLQGVFTGETQALKGLGIVMTQTNLQAFAMSQGITKSVSDMSQAEQVMLRYMYVMHATADAQGDFARTGDSFANQTRKLGQSVKELGESFGSLLLPVITPIIEAIGDFVKRIGEMDERTKRIIISIGLVAAAVGPLLLVGGKLLTFISTLKTALAALSVNPVLLGIGAVTAAIAGVVALSGALDNSKGKSTAIADEYLRMKSAMEKNTSAEISITARDDATDGVIATASRLVDQLTQDAYAGKIAIDGDPQKAIKMLETVKRTIDNTKARIQEISANPEEAYKTIGEIQEQLALLEKVVVITDDPAARQTLVRHIQALKDRLGRLNTQIKITATAAEAEGIIDDLENGAYSGSIAIDGDPEKVTTLLGNIRRTINNTRASIGEIGANPKEANDVIKQIETDIEALHGVVVITDDPAKQRLIRSRLTTLQGMLNSLKQQVQLSTSFEYDQSTTAADIEAFRQALAGLPKNETYKAIGKFEVSDITLTNAENFAAKLGEAAHSITGYKEAVEEMGTIIDQQKNERIDAVYAQEIEQLSRLDTMHKEGRLSDSQLREASDKVYEEAEKQIAEIEARYDAIKKQADVFTNGVRSDDRQGLYDMVYELAPATSEAAEGANAMATAASAASVALDESENAITRQVSAIEASRYFMDAFAQSTQSAADALAQYNAEIDAAHGITDDNGMTVEELNAHAQALHLMAEAVREYGRQGMDHYATPEQHAEDTWQLYKDKLSREDFDYAIRTANQSNRGYFGAEDQAATLDAAAAEVEKRAADLDSKTQEAVQTAKDNLMSAFEQLTGEQNMLTAEQTQGMIAALEEAGATFTDAEKEFLTGNAQAMESAYQAALGAMENGGDPSVYIAQAVEQSQALEQAMNSKVSEAASSAAGQAETGGQQIGNALMSGMTLAVQNGTGPFVAAMAAAVGAGIAAAKARGQIESPSKVMRREVGAMLTRGMALGVRDEVPASLKIVKASTEKLMVGVSGAAAGGVNAIPRPAQPKGIDYTAMGAAMKRAMSGVRFGFSVGDKDLAAATADATARQMAFTTRRAVNSVGG